MMKLIGPDDRLSGIQQQLVGAGIFTMRTESCLLVEPETITKEEAEIILSKQQQYQPEGDACC